MPIVQSDRSVAAPLAAPLLVVVVLPDLPCPPSEDESDQMFLPETSAAQQRHLAAPVVVPAMPDSIAVVRSLVGEALGTGCDDVCYADLQLAADELASVLILAASPDARLWVSIERDDEDAYVRMSVSVDEGHPDPLADGLTRHLLLDTVTSYEVFCEGRELFGVLQRELGQACRSVS